MLEPSSRTSAFSKSPSFGSIVKTTPPLSSIRCPGPPDAGIAPAVMVAAAHPANPIAATAPTASPALLEAKNSRRDTTGTDSAVRVGSVVGSHMIAPLVGADSTGAHALAAWSNAILDQSADRRPAEKTPLGGVAPHGLGAAAGRPSWPLVGRDQLPDAARAARPPVRCARQPVPLTPDASPTATFPDPSRTS